MDWLLSEGPCDSFDYWDETVKRWDWTRAKLEDPTPEQLISDAASPRAKEDAQ
jgi:hypothetical protein